MQNFIITLVLFLLSFFVSAQEKPEKFTLEKGTVALGGGFGINSGSSQDDSYEGKSFGFNLRPEAAYFIGNNLSLGMFFRYSYYSNEYTRSDDFRSYKNNAITIAPYLKKYFSFSEAFAFNLTGSLDYSRNWSKDESDDCLNCTNSTRNTYGIAVRPGLTYLISDRLSLDANIGLLRYTYNDINEADRNISNNSFDLNFGLSNIILGLTYYLN